MVNMTLSTDNPTTNTVNMTTEASAPFQVGLTDEAPDTDNARIRVHLNIRASDIGFEALHRELSLLESDGDRARFVKKQLIKLGVGQTLAVASSMPVSPNLSTAKNFKVDFGLSSRNLGLEKLFADLSKLSTTVERNQHVKRCLFNGFANIKNSCSVKNQSPETRGEVSILLQSQAASSTETTVHNPWGSSDFAPTPAAPTAEESAMARAAKKKANVAKFLSQK